MTNFSDEEIGRQLTLGEDSVWEFKQIEFSGDRPRKPRPDDLANEIAAFANSDGGVLLCGITDRGDVQGMSREQMDALVDVLGDICAQKIRPPLSATIRRRMLSDGKPFVLVEVPKGDAQHDSPGGSFRRVGSSKRRMTGDERLRLGQRRGQARFLWFDQQPVPETGFGTLDEGLWRPLLSSRALADPAVSLEKMGLLVRDDAGVVRPSVTGLLMCSTTPDQWLPHVCITATPIPGARPCFWPAGRPSHHRPAQPADHQGRGLRHAQHARRGSEDAGTRRLAPVQRSGGVRSHRQRRGTPGLLHRRQPHPTIDVRGPDRDQFPGCSAERNDGREHGHSPIDAKRGARLGSRANVCGEHRGIARPGLLHGKEGRRHPDHLERNGETERAGCPSEN